jgi:hypothetical protein
MIPPLVPPGEAHSDDSSGKMRIEEQTHVGDVVWGAQLHRRLLSRERILVRNDRHEPHIRAQSNATIDVRISYFRTREDTSTLFPRTEYMPGAAARRKSPLSSVKVCRQHVCQSIVCNTHATKSMSATLMQPNQGLQHSCNQRVSINCLQHSCNQSIRKPAALAQNHSLDRRPTWRLWPVACS